MTGKRSGLGRCRHFFWLGVLFDTVGVAVLFTGVFADLLFYDMLLYLGSIIIFFSLLWWVSWYTGNIELASEDAVPKAARSRSGSVVESLRRSVSIRFSQTFESFSQTLELLRRRRRGRWPRLNLRSGSQILVVPGSPTWGRKDPDWRLRVADVSQGDLGPLPEGDGSSEVAGSSGLTAAGRTHLERPVESMELRPPFPVLPSRSQPVISLVSTLQPCALPASKSEFVVSLTSGSQPPDALPLTSQPRAPVVAKSHPPVPVFSQGPFQVPVAAESHLVVPVASQSQDLPPSRQTRPFSVEDSESQTLIPQASEMPLSSTQSFQNVDLRSCPSSEDFVIIYRSRQFSSTLVPISASQSSALMEISKKIVAQVFESLKLPQKLSQEFPDTMSPVPEAADLAAESRQSLPTPSTDPATESRQSLPTRSTDPASESRQSLPTRSTDPAMESRQPLPTPSTDLATESRQSLPTPSTDPATESRQSLPTPSTDPAAESRQSLPTRSIDPAPESRQSLPTRSTESATESRQSLPTPSTDPAAESRQSLPTRSTDPATESRQSLSTDSNLALGAAKKSHPS
ncbi:uncharacterized protein ACOB7L_003352 [Callospermophilus lateralis]|uniref:uncharacterized protein LOC143385126 n=1 Tax=Callospermophilus lateralis TaxID=76772 RepID=UPI004054665C